MQHSVTPVVPSELITCFGRYCQIALAMWHESEEASGSKDRRQAMLRRRANNLLQGAVGFVQHGAICWADNLVAALASRCTTTLEALMTRQQRFMAKCMHAIRKHKRVQIKGRAQLPMIQISSRRTNSHVIVDYEMILSMLRMT